MADNDFLGPKNMCGQTLLRLVRLGERHGGGKATGREKQRRRKGRAFFSFSLLLSLVSLIALLSLSLYAVFLPFGRYSLLSLCILWSAIYALRSAARGGLCSLVLHTALAKHLHPSNSTLSLSLSLSLLYSLTESPLSLSLSLSLTLSSFSETLIPAALPSFISLPPSVASLTFSLFPPSTSPADVAGQRHHCRAPPPGGLCPGGVPHGHKGGPGEARRAVDMLTHTHTRTYTHVPVVVYTCRRNATQKTPVCIVVHPCATLKPLSTRSRRPPMFRSLRHDHS